MKKDELNMKQKKQFLPPVILREYSLYPEGAILDGSLVDPEPITVQTIEQDVKNHDFSGGTFNHEWD